MLFFPFYGTLIHIHVIYKEFKKKHSHATEKHLSVIKEYRDATENVEIIVSRADVVPEVSTGGTKVILRSFDVATEGTA